MHEYPLTLNIIEIAEKHAKEKGARVKKIVLVIGEGSGIIGESIRLYFDIIAENTLCEGAEIEIQPVKPLLKCDTCGTLFQRKPFEFACPKPDCGGSGAPTEIGREFYVKTIEIEV